jgi:flavodoxin
MKQQRILVVYFTQSGQMRTIAERFCAPFAGDADSSVAYEELKLAQPFPFPWSAFTFFNAFPETFFEKPVALQALSDKVNDDYDLVVLAYQPWFLTPSPAMSSFLQKEEAKKLLTNKKVVTLIGCRNMWLGAQEKVKKRLVAVGAELVANVALVDRSPNVVSVVTILRWMLKGKKDPFWGFPAAGVSDADLDKCTEYGKMVQKRLSSDQWEGLQEELNAQGAVEIVPELVLMEQRGQRAFGIWSKFIGAAPIGSLSRSLRVYIYMTLLPTAVFILSPLLAIISWLLLKLKNDELVAEVKYFKQNKLRM